MGAFFCFFLTTSERTLRGLVKPRYVTSKQRVLTKNLGFSQIFASFDSQKNSTLELLSRMAVVAVRRLTLPRERARAFEQALISATGSDVARNSAELAIKRIFLRS